MESQAEQSPRLVLVSRRSLFLLVIFWPPDKLESTDRQKERVEERHEYKLAGGCYHRQETRKETHALHDLPVDAGNILILVSRLSLFLLPEPSTTGHQPRTQQQPEPPSIILSNPEQGAVC